MPTNKTLVVRKKLKDGTLVKYTYDTIGGVSVPKYMYEKLKVRRQQQRHAVGKVLSNEIDDTTLQHIKQQHQSGYTIAAIAKSNGLSWYLVHKTVSA